MIPWRSRSAWVAAALTVALALAQPALGAATIRVQLVHDKLRALISSDGGLAVRPLDFESIAQNRPPPPLLSEMTTQLALRAQPGGLLMADAVPVKGPVLVSPLLGAPLSLDGKPYRGSMVVLPNIDGTLSVIDIVDLEQYVYGVVPAEVPSSWPQQTLEAQAIVARSYALARAGSDAHPMYDVESGEGDQVYGGLDAETAATTTAVDATRNVVVVYGGQVATTYYSACDGGHTSDGAALEDPQPYLVAKPDPYCALSPYMHWETVVPVERFQREFEKVFASVGLIRDVSAGPLDDSGRLQSVTVIGERDSFVISGADFRLFAGQHAVRSLRIATVAKNGDHIFVSGAGFGHGVGMCQYGARGMALAGHTAAEILRFYYSGAQLESLSELGRSP